MPAKPLTNVLYSAAFGCMSLVTGIMLCTPMLDASTLWIPVSAELYDECVIQLAYELLQVLD